MPRKKIPRRLKVMEWRLNPKNGRENRRLIVNHPTTVPRQMVRHPMVNRHLTISLRQMESRRLMGSRQAITNRPEPERRRLTTNLLWEASHPLKESQD